MTDIEFRERMGKVIGGEYRTPELTEIHAARREEYERLKRYHSTANCKLYVAQVEWADPQQALIKVGISIHPHQRAWEVGNRIGREVRIARYWGYDTRAAARLAEVDIHYRLSHIRVCFNRGRVEPVPYCSMRPDSEYFLFNCFNIARCWLIFENIRKGRELEAAQESARESSS